jgi:N-dimethylarginine dimethylaminohydrolase
MVFTAEAGHPLPAREPGGKPRFLLPRVKPQHRHGERDRWKPFVERLGFEAVEVTSDAIWEAQGDVAHFDGATLLFYGGRTELRGMHAARTHFDGEVLELCVREPAFHGNMALLPVPQADSIIVCADVVDDDSLALLEARVGRDRMHFVSQEELRCYATNGLPIGDTLLCPTNLPVRVRTLFEKLGVKVVELPMIELCDKGGGASRCMVCIFENAPDGLSIPDEARLSFVRERRLGVALSARIDFRAAPRAPLRAAAHSPPEVDAAAEETRLPRCRSSDRWGSRTRAGRRRRAGARRPSTSKCRPTRRDRRNSMPRPACPPT